MKNSNGMKKSYILSLIFFFCPILTLAFADFNLAGSTFRGIILYILDIISVLIPILFALAFILFFWGLSKFILNAGNKEGIQQGRDYMLWGILALFILVSLKPIINLISNELEFGSNPTVNGILLPQGSTPNVSTDCQVLLPDGSTASCN